MASPTVQDIVFSMTRGRAGWASSVVTFGFPTAASDWTDYGPGSEPYRTDFRALTATEADAFRKAIAAYDSYIALSFKEVQEPGTSADIRAAVTTDTLGLGGWASGPNQGVRTGGDIWIDAKQSPNYYLLLHELGHALGLVHPNDAGTLLPVAYQGWPYSNMGGGGGGYAPLVLSVQGVGSNAKPSLDAIMADAPKLYDVLALQTLYGADPETGKGDTVYALNAPATIGKVLYDASGTDTIDASANTRSSTIDLEPGSFSSIGQYSAEDQARDYKALYPQIDWSAWLDPANPLFTWTNNVAIAFGTIIENAIGGAANDVISGNSVANELTGLGGDDVLDGRDGIDTAIFRGVSSDYTWQKGQDGTWTVRDSRAGRDGVDTLRNIEILRFADKSVALAVSLSPTIETAFASILRAGSGSTAYASFASDLQLKIYAGATDAAAVSAIIRAAGSATSVATLAYEFFTGKVPTQNGVDFLISPTGPNPNNLNSAYYAKFDTVNRYINFAVNLGKNGEAKDSFAAKYGGLSLIDATKEAYKVIFGATPTDAKAHSLIDSRVDYLAYYGGDGPTGIGTKAAMVGFLLAAAATEDVGVMARSHDAWLTDLSDGSAPFAIDILDPAKGYYKTDFIFGG